MNTNTFPSCHWICTICAKNVTGTSHHMDDYIFCSEKCRIRYDENPSLIRHFNQYPEYLPKLKSPKSKLINVATRTIKKLLTKSNKVESPTQQSKPTIASRPSQALLVNLEQLSKTSSEQT